MQIVLSPPGPHDFKLLFWDLEIYLHLQWRPVLMKDCRAGKRKKKMV